jgi:hypothetical protein
LREGESRRVVNCARAPAPGGRSGLRRGHGGHGHGGAEMRAISHQRPYRGPPNDAHVLPLVPLPCLRNLRCGGGAAIVRL